MSAKLLVDAADKVDELLATLDNTSHRCECCERVVWHSWLDHTDFEMLTAVKAKLMRIAAGRLKRENIEVP